MIDVEHYVYYNSFFNKNVKLKTELSYFSCIQGLQRVRLRSLP